MPQLGESVTEGTVTRWLKNVGDTVTADEPLLEVSTDKVDTEIPAPVSGVLTEIIAGEDAVVLVGGALGVIAESASANTLAATPAPAPAVAAPEPVAVPESVSVPEPVAVAVAASAATPTPASNGASIPVLLPALGESVTEGTVTRWLKAVGDSVAADEAILEVSTDKVDTEIPSPVAGVLLEITVPEDGVALVGGQLGLISSSASAPAAPVAPAPVAPAASVPAPSAPTTPSAQSAAPVQAAAPVAQSPVTQSPVDNSQTYTTPLVRKLAAQLGVDLTKVVGTGVGGRIRKEDVSATTPTNAPVNIPAERPVESKPHTAPAAVGISPKAAELRGKTEKMTRLRTVIAERMVESLQVSAQLTSVVEVDVTRIAALRNKSKAAFEQREGVKLTFLPFFAKAACEALKQYPTVNASINQVEGTVTYFEAEHLGIAVDTERGLVVPVVRDAGDLNIAGLARKISELAERTRINKLSPDELSGGTFTITNTGSRGALFDTPIINQPQVAILGTGAVVKRPVVVADSSGADVIAVRQMVYLALTYDHRLVDGADAARFLSTIKARLEEGAFEADLGL
jgi:2-oxoglutarate dehydrogenase E2 component (dihydrolipoamide succinyltransferase)